jgi:hypothetical protein
MSRVGVDSVDDQVRCYVVVPIRYRLAMLLMSMID